MMESKQQLDDGLPATLANRYRVEEVVGRGGYATVYRAADVRHQRVVAIKVIRPESRAEAERFQREIGIVARLHHPNILPLFDSGTIDGYVYFVMPFVQRGTLRDLLQTRGALPVAQALEIARQVALGLDVANEHGVIHRDVKPENIMMYEGQAAIADFGLARQVGRPTGEPTTDTRQVAGTPEYMSPERVAGGTADQPSDVYSLGCVLFEMLSGGPPFGGSSPQIVASKHLSEPPPIHSLRGYVPSHVIRVLERALAKEPSQRFARLGELHRALTDPEYTSSENRGWWRVAASVAAIVTVIAASLLLLPANAPSPDPNGVVVFPLVHRGVAAPEQRRGYDVALVIEAGLESAQPLKWIDGWERLDVEAREDPSRLTAERARRIALAQRAGFYLTGTLFERGDSTSVTLRLWDAVADTLVAQRTASDEAATRSIFHLGVEATIGLLPRLIDPVRNVSLDDLLQRDAGAIALWIQGERRYRLARFDSALVFFQRALERDSALTPAAFKAALAADWVQDDATAEQYLALVTPVANRLSSRQRYFAWGLEAYAKGDGAAAAIWADSALAADPDWAEAATLAGEIRHHLISSLAPLDSVAESYFIRARSADTTFFPPSAHLAEIALRRGDLAAARRHLRAFEAAGGDREQIRHVSLFARCDAADIDWRAQVSRAPGPVLAGAQMMSGTGWGACVKDALAAVAADPAYAWGAFLALQARLLAEGSFQEAEALIDSAAAAGAGRTGSLFLLASMAGAPLGHRAELTVAAAQERFGPDYLESPGPQAEWLMGSWYGFTGELDRATALHRVMERRAAESADPRDSVLSGAIGAEIDLLRGDTAAALSTILSLTPRSSQTYLAWEFADALPRQYLLAAEILHAQGRHRDAIRVAGVLDHRFPVHYVTFLPASLALRYDASRALGDAEAAERYRRRLLDLGRADVLDRVGEG